MRNKTGKSAAKRNMQKLHSGGEYWQPEKVGEKFCGRITGHHIGVTKFGEKPFIEIASEETGEVIAIIAGNVRLRSLNRLPIGSYVELEYLGQDNAIIGGKRKKIANICGYYDANQNKLGEDWTGGKYYGKDEKAGKTKRRKPKKANRKTGKYSGVLN